MAKEVKKPRKPATKKATKEKKEKNVTDLTNLKETELVEKYKELPKDELFKVTDIQVDTLSKHIVDQEQESTKKDELKPEDIVTNADFNETEKDNNKEKAEEENQLKPQEVIEEFTEATKKLDNIMISENPEEVLKKELERANEVAEQLKKQIKEQESNYYNPSKPWNGVTDGWFDY